MKKQQQGAVLIVSLVILLITTLLGTAAMQGTGLEMKMAKNVEERQKVFQAAETALRKAENILDSKAYKRADLNSAACAAGDPLCFEETCAGGLCFFGDSSAPLQVDCEVYDGAPPSYPVWDKNNPLNVWNDSSKYLTIPTIRDVSFKYIIEFQCYVDGINFDVENDDAGDASYRVTLLATKDNTSVMLQTTYGIWPF